MVKHSTSLFVCSDLNILRLKTLRFSSVKIKVFYSIFVSSFSVYLYASHSSAEDFPSKSRRPGLDLLVLCFEQAAAGWEI